MAKKNKYRFYWKAERKPYGFVNGAIYEVEKIDGESCIFKGYGAVHLFSDFEKVEEVD
jgi:hypothetical protein